MKNAQASVDILFLRVQMYSNIDILTLSTIMVPGSKKEWQRLHDVFTINVNKQGNIRRDIDLILEIH